MNYWGAIGVAWFELRRSFSAGRIGLWFLMALFPVLLAHLVKTRTGADASNEAAFVLILFFLIVRVACVMGLLLWATPVVSEEIEGRTWMYVATRPGGSVNVVLGKYLVALVWSISAGLVATAGAVPASGVAQVGRAIAVISALVVLGCIAYGSLFVLIGTVIQRRAMVAAIIYVVLIDGLMSVLPATINRFTVGYRLLSLLVNWMEYQDSIPDQDLKMLFSDSYSATHVGILALYSAALLAAALIRVRMGGYLTDPED